MTGNFLYAHSTSVPVVIVLPGLVVDFVVGITAGLVDVGLVEVDTFEVRGLALVDGGVEFDAFFPAVRSLPSRRDCFSADD